MAVPALAGVSASGRSPYFPDDRANAVIQGTLSAVAPTKPFAFNGPLNVFVWGEFTTSLTATNGSLTASVAAAGALAAGAAIKSTLLPYGATMSAIAGTDITVVLPIYTYSGFVTSGLAQVRELFQTSRLTGAVVSGIGVTSSQTVSAIATPAIAPSFPGDPKGARGIVTLSAVATAQQSDNKVPSPYEFALVASGAVTTGVDAAAVFTSAAIGLTGSVQLERSFDGGQTWIVCNIGAGGLAQWSTATPLSFCFGEPEQMMLYRLNVTALTPSTGIALKYRISETGQAARSLNIPTL